MGIIYLATSLLTGKHYIGQTTKTLEQRKAKHLQNSETDLNNKFYQAIRKHGIDSFQWEILEEIEDDNLDEREIYWIREFNSLYEGYNMTIGGGTVTGYKHSEESKKKIGRSRSGKSMKDIYIEKYGEKKGLEVFDRYCNKLKKNNGKGKTRLELFIERHGEVEGRIKYNAFVQSIKDARKRNPVSGFKGKIMTNEQKEKISKGNKGKLKGKSKSEETKRKMSESSIKYWKQKKELN